MEKVRKRIVWAVIASESIHIFCCVLPTVFSILGLLAGAGMIIVLPSFIAEAHDIIHAYEVPMIFMSGVILVLGWALYHYSRQMSCRTEGTCCHQPCESKKDRAKSVMIMASFLFLVNICVYFSFHQSAEAYTGSVQVQDEHHHHYNHGHTH